MVSWVPHALSKLQANTVLIYGWLAELLDVPTVQPDRKLHDVTDTAGRVEFNVRQEDLRIPLQGLHLLAVPS